MLDQLLMKWIVREGKDMFNLQANSFDIAKGIQEDLDMEMMKIGISITVFNISSFTYPEEIQKEQKQLGVNEGVQEVLDLDNGSATAIMKKNHLAGTVMLSKKRIDAI